MNKKTSPLTVVALVALIFGMIFPVALSAYLTKQEVIRGEKNRAFTYALDVLARSEAVTDQIDTSFKSLEATRGDPCSAANQTLMKQIDISSSYIQAIGYMAGNHVVCSSLDTELVNIDLGPVDMVRPSGVEIRLNVEFPFAKGTKFLAVERRGFVAIIHKDLPIDATTYEDGVSLATVANPEAHILTARGLIRPNWINAIGAKSRTFVDDNYVVAVAASERYLIDAIGAIPISAANKRINEALMVTIPIGLLASVLLALAAFHLAKLRSAMPAAIKGALRRKEFFLEYQPVVELSTGQWIGAEALIRWRRMKGEIVRPDIFIPVAEENGLIKLISQYVVRQIASEVGDLFERFPEFHIAINLSAEDFHDEATILMLRELAAATGARRGSIIVEATERSFTNYSVASPVITRLRAEGFPVAIDDFGTGYSSLSSLERIRFDYLKIDKSFVDTLNTDAATGEVILHIIGMAKSLNIEMIAEGVETELQAEFLQERGVKYAQGWHFGKPMPFAKLLLGLETQPFGKMTATSF